MRQNDGCRRLIHTTCNSASNRDTLKTDLIHSFVHTCKHINTDAHIKATELFHWEDRDHPIFPSYGNSNFTDLHDFMGGKPLQTGASILVIIGKCIFICWSSHQLNTHTPPNNNRHASSRKCCLCINTCSHIQSITRYPHSLLSLRPHLSSDAYLILQR